MIDEIILALVSYMGCAEWHKIPGSEVLCLPQKIKVRVGLATCTSFKKHKFLNLYLFLFW